MIRSSVLLPLPLRPSNATHFAGTNRHADILEHRECRLAFRQGKVLLQVFGAT